MSEPVHLRPATADDRAFLLSLVPRLRAFGPPPLRPDDALDRAERETLSRAIDEPSPDAVVFVAELADDGPVGAAYALTSVDYFTGERHGHLSVLVVSEAGEGRGVGRALLSAVEAWAADWGYRFVTLNVFAGNDRARTVYERAGYGEDTVRYVKEL